MVEMPNNRSKILLAAKELVSGLGTKAATIAKVAKKAGVADSLVYKYFANKEDLLFSIAKLRVQESVEELREQLQGLKDPESKLRKLVWHSLTYNDRHPDYLRILLFECRSNPRFYRSEAYEAMLRHARITGEILKQGRDEGVFNPDVDIRLMREIIYGALDCEAVSSAAVNEIEASADDFKDLIEFLLSILLVGSAPAPLPNQERIQLAAEKVFGEHGFQKATIAEIASRAGVAEGNIYDYFKNKEDLIMTIAETRFQDHLDKLPQIFNISDHGRKLRRLLKYHFSLYLPNRDFLKIFLFDIYLNYDFFHSRSFEVFNKYIREIETVIEEGKAAGASNSP